MSNANVELHQDRLNMKVRTIQKNYTLKSKSYLLEKVEKTRIQRDGKWYIKKAIEGFEEMENDISK